MPQPLPEALAELSMLLGVNRLSTDGDLWELKGFQHQPGCDAAPPLLGEGSQLKLPLKCPATGECCAETAASSRALQTRGCADLQCLQAPSDTALTPPGP